MKKALLGVLIFFLISETSLAFWPIFWEFDGEYHFLGPLFSYRTKEDGTHATFRPFFSSYDSKRGSRFLYPLGKISDELSYFIPVYASKKTEDRSYWSFLFFYGGSSERRRYFGFFPFFGHIYDNFGIEEAKFFLWPIYGYTSQDGKVKTDLIWPFFSIYEGKERGIKIWPIYGNREEKEGGRRTFFMWPIFFIEEKAPQTEEYSKTFFFFPIFLSKKSKTLKDTYFLFPLFNYKKGDDLESYKILWPFFSYERSENSLRYSFFPFFSLQRKDKDRTLSLFYPLYREEEWYVNEKRFIEKRFLLFSGIKNFPEERSVTFWPFFDSIEKVDTYNVSFPFVVPLRNEEFKRIVAPLITLYEEKRAKGRKSVNFLYGFFTMEERDACLKIRFAFLIDYQRNEDVSEISLLSGLLGFDNKGLKRIFFIPLR